MKYSLFLNNGLAVSKCICYSDLSSNEIEITEEQFNQINEFPLKLNINEDNNLVSWEKTELSYEEPVEIVKEPTFEERLTIAEDTINFLLGL